MKKKETQEGWITVIIQSSFDSSHKRLQTMQMQELTVDDILRVIVEHQDTIDLLQGNIITRARLLQYTQTQYEALVTLAKQSIELISNIREGDTIGPEWAVTRDQIIAKAQRLIEDAYGKGIQE